jgi:hypothetical protein
MFILDFQTALTRLDELDDTDIALLQEIERGRTYEGDQVTPNEAAIILNMIDFRQTHTDDVERILITTGLYPTTLRLRSLPSERIETDKAIAKIWSDGCGNAECETCKVPYDVRHYHRMKINQALLPTNSCNPNETFRQSLTRSLALLNAEDAARKDGLGR